MSNQKSSLYTIVLPVKNEYLNVVEDALRLLTIQSTIFFMYSISSSTPVSGANYLVMQIFMLIGVAIYWLVLRKIVKIETLR